MSQSNKDRTNNLLDVEARLRMILSLVQSIHETVPLESLGKRGHWRLETVVAIQHLLREELQLARSFRVWSDNPEAKSHPDLCVKCHDIMVDVDEKARSAKWLWSYYGGTRSKELASRRRIFVISSICTHP